MNLDFLKEMGESLKGTGVDTPEEFEKLLMDRVRAMRLKVTDLDIQYDKGVATVMGMVDTQENKEKVLLAVGNVKGVAKVKDSMAVGLSAKAQNEVRKSAATKAGAKSSEIQIAAGKAAEKARKDVQRQLEMAKRREAFKQEILARRDAEKSKTAFYTVVKGDSLRKIAKKHYGDESKWKAIFDANQPMIKKADLIYAGQVLRIPKLG